jgi:hypothetical protein
MAAALALEVYWAGHSYELQVASFSQHICRSSVAASHSKEIQVKFSASVFSTELFGQSIVEHEPTRPQQFSFGVAAHETSAQSKFSALARCIHPAGQENILHLPSGAQHLVSSTSLQAMPAQKIVTTACFLTVPTGHGYSEQGAAFSQH